MSKTPTTDRFWGLLHVLLLVPVVVLLPSTVLGAGSELTEDEFLESIDPAHPAVVALTGALAQAEGELRRAGVFENPTIEFEYEAPAEQADQSTLKLGWKPPLDGRRGLAVDIGKASVEAARSELEWARLELRQELRAIFADWALAQRQEELVARHLESVRELESRLQVRAERGEESLLAARRLSLAVTEVRTVHARAEAELLRSRARAFAMSGDLPPGVVAVMPAAPPVPSVPDSLVRPDIAALGHEARAASLERKLAGRILEFPTLIAGWTRVSVASENFDGPYFGVVWDFPLFDRNQGNREEMSRRIEVANARLTLAAREAERGREAEVAIYAAMFGRLSEIADVVVAAPELVDAASAAFLAGESTMTDLLETLRSVLSTQLDALAFHADVLHAHRALELGTGRILTQGESR